MSTTSTPRPIEFSTNEPRAAAFIVYINGIEVPVKSVSQRFGVWQIPEMTIEMVADPVLSRLGAEDRVQVTVFDYDDVAPDDSVKPDFRLFGEGEITGWGYQNTGGGRSIVFTVVNQFAIFTQLFVQFLTNVDDMLGYATFGGSGVTNPANLTSELIFPFSLFKKGLLVPVGKDAPSKNASGQNPDDINRPFDFLYNIVKCLAGPVPATQRAVPAANFFSRWARLTNFVNRFMGSPVFDEPNILAANPNTNIFPILKALQTTSAVDVITKNLIPQIQNAGSFYDVVSMVYQMVFMEVAMIPTMPLVTVDLASSIVEATDFTKHTLTTGREMEGVLNNAIGASVLVQQSVQLDKAIPAHAPNALKPNRIPNYFPKPQFLFGLPPSCNVFFPSQVKVLAYEENYATQPTRLYFNDEVLNNVMGQPSDGLGQTMMNALSTAYPPEADAANKARQLVNAKASGKNFLLFPEEFYKGPVMDRRPIPTWLYFLRQNESTRAGQQLGTLPNSLPSGVEPAKADLYETLKTGHPDVYRLYAEYEFFRERFSRRAGSVQLGWNPYVVPGFPMAVFDHRATRVDLFAYVTTVQHAMTHRSRSTTVSFTYGRTIQESFDLMKNIFAEGSSALAMAPREPIRDVRQVVQSFTDAESYYRKLFYGNQALYNKDASMDWRKIIAYAPAVAGQEPEPIYVAGGNEALLTQYEDAGEFLSQNRTTLDLLKQKVASLTQQKTAADAVQAKLQAETTVDQVALQKAVEDAASLASQLAVAQKEAAALQQKVSAAEAIRSDPSYIKQNQVTHNLTGDRELVPTRAAERYFEYFEAAMEYNWRPRCTLDEYIIFFNSAGESPIPAFGHPRSVGVRYFERIRRLTPLTATTTLPTGADGLTAQTQAAAGAGTQSAPQTATGETTTHDATVPVVPGLGKDFPQTRADWDSILEAYRNNAYNVKTPRV